MRIHNPIMSTGLDDAVLMLKNKTAVIASDITSLKINCKFFGVAGAIRLAAALAGNESLTALSLSVRYITLLFKKCDAVLYSSDDVLSKAHTLTYIHTHSH
jgi:hypothetical protein